MYSSNPFADLQGYETSSIAIGDNGALGFIQALTQEVGFLT